MGESVLVVIEEPTDVSHARRVAAGLAESLRFGEVVAGEIAIVVTEVSTNMLKHAGRGYLLLRVTGAETGAVPELELLALDNGPGMRNLERCLADGYSTGGTPGHGLGAVRRLSSDSDFYSLPSEGTAILARWRSGEIDVSLPLRVGVVNLAKKGQDVCGDSWGIEDNGDVSSIMVADGLGHGQEANTASQEAVATLRKHSGVRPEELLQLTHLALRHTRGAAVAVARIDRSQQRISFAGVGNIMAQIYCGAEVKQHLVSVNGTAGHQCGRIREFTYPWPPDGTLVLFSDGLASGAAVKSRPGLAGHDPSLIAGTLFRDFNRGSDDSTVVVAKAVAA